MRPIPPAPARRSAESLAGSGLPGLVVALVLLAQPLPAHAIIAGPDIDSTRVAYLGSYGVPIQGPMGIAIVPRSHEVALANTGAGRIEFFDAEGHPRGSFLHLVRNSDGALRSGQPKHVAAGEDGLLYITDIASPDVDVCDFRGRSIVRVSLPAPDDRLSTGGAGALALASDGRLFVASRSGGRIHVFSPEHRLIESWGVAGSDSGQMAAISGLAWNSPDEVVVTCIATDLGVQIFDAHGAIRRGFGIHDIGPGRFSQPVGVTVTPDGRIWVVDGIRANLQVFERDGALVGVVGGGEGSTGWLYPSALASDGNGLFAIAESGGNRVRLLWVHAGQRTDQEVVSVSSHGVPQSHETRLNTPIRGEQP